MPRNPNKTAVIAVSLPVPMAQQVERHRKAEHRSRSEVVREALRVYFARADTFAQVSPTPAEARALKRARRDYVAGNTITLDEYERRRGLVRAAQPKSRKAPRPATAARQRGRKGRAQGARA